MNNMQRDQTKTRLVKDGFDWLEIKIDAVLFVIKPPPASEATTYRKHPGIKEGFSIASCI